MKREEFNIHLSKEDRKVIDALMHNNVNVSGTFKTFIRKYLKEIEKINVDLNIQNKT